jgi:ParB-like chromosome segregation protein Spo0J
MLKEIKITDIRVGQRHRRDMGDLTSLAESICQEGLLQPIGVTDRLELVFGERRIRAVRDILKKRTILARIVDVSSILAGEYAENEIRKDFFTRRCGNDPSGLRFSERYGLDNADGGGHVGGGG